VKVSSVQVSPARKGQQRHPLPGQRLGRQIECKAHRQPDFARRVAVEALHAAERAVLADQLKVLQCHVQSL
jgi:hypothetical protein